MSLLHIVAKSPFTHQALAACLARLGQGDALLLMEDAVAAAVAAAATPWPDRGPVFVLSPDLAARGLADRPLRSGVTLVDYGGFVDLAARHDGTLSWF